MLYAVETEKTSVCFAFFQKQIAFIRNYRKKSKETTDVHFETAIDSIRTQLRRAHSVVLDDDVLAEQKMIHSIMHPSQFRSDASKLAGSGAVRYAKSDFALLVHYLSKQFGEKRAVDNLSFSVRRQECFGFLGKNFDSFLCSFLFLNKLFVFSKGINGAGKTTTFRMLVGEHTPTSGDALIDDISLIKSKVGFRSRIGYCPQFDALFDNMTGVETLELFARLRGVPEASLTSHINRIIRLCDLTRHANRVSESYSGGTKRKLSVGIALTGRPSVLLLDEPTCGVDPKARRRIWQTLMSVRKSQQCSLLLTSHSMDECEALCGRIAIMTAGQLRCLGSIQHLRNKYGHGYSLCIKLRSCYLHDEGYLVRLQNAICQSLPSAIIKDVHQTVMDYHIGDTTIGWANLFNIMDSIKEKFNLENYFIGDTTLEEIFVGFARQQQAQKNGP